MSLCHPATNCPATAEDETSRLDATPAKAYLTLAALFPRLHHLLCDRVHSLRLGPLVTIRNTQLRREGGRSVQSCERALAALPNMRRRAVAQPRPHLSVDTIRSQWPVAPPALPPSRSHLRHRDAGRLRYRRRRSLPRAVLPAPQQWPRRAPRRELVASRIERVIRRRGINVISAWLHDRALHLLPFLTMRFWRSSGRGRRRVRCSGSPVSRLPSDAAVVVIN